MTRHIIRITCSDEKGLIARISQVLFQEQINIEVMREFVEIETNQFYVRAEVVGVLDEELLEHKIMACLPKGARVQVQAKRKKRIVVLVTKEYHCLSDLLTRHHFGELNAEIMAVIGNHNNLRPFVEKFELPYLHISHEGKTKEVFESELLTEIAQYKPEVLVLAKFMRILSPDFVAHYEHSIINIHHSFLPAFIGANPYKQAYERGVKLIGATAHIVNNDLDEGPIISQKVVQVDHTFSLQHMVQAGHEVEKSVLAEAMQWVLDDRVFVSGNKTILFV